MSECTTHFYLSDKWSKANDALLWTFMQEHYKVEVDKKSEGKDSRWDYEISVYGSLFFEKLRKRGHIPSVLDTGYPNRHKVETKNDFYTEREGLPWATSNFAFESEQWDATKGAFVPSGFTATYSTIWIHYHCFEWWAFSTERLRHFLHTNSWYQVKDIGNRHWVHGVMVPQKDVHKLLTPLLLGGIEPEMAVWRE